MPGSLLTPNWRQCSYRIAPSDFRPRLSVLPTNSVLTLNSQSCTTYSTQLIVQDGQYPHATASSVSAAASPTPRNRSGLGTAQRDDRQFTKECKDLVRLMRKTPCRMSVSTTNFLDRVWAHIVDFIHSNTCESGMPYAQIHNPQYRGTR